MIPLENPLAQEAHLALPANEKMISRDPPDPSAARRALVSKWQKSIQDDKAFWEKDHKRIRRNMQIAYAGAEEDWIKNDFYVVPICMWHINNSVASLYARNPTAEAKLRKRLMFNIWDGRIETVQEAMADLTNPDNISLLEEVLEVQKYQQMLKRVGKSLELLFDYYINEPEPNFKVQFKQMVRTGKVCGVGYVWLSFMRKLDPNPEVVSQIEDITSKISNTERLLAELKDGEIDENSAEAEALRLSLSDLQGQMSDLEPQKDIVAREAPVFDFPSVLSVIPHKKCTNLQGFVGASYITREYQYTDDEIKTRYKIDPKSTGGSPSESLDLTVAKTSDEEKEPSKDVKNVWKVYDKDLKQTFTILEGYPDFLEEPHTPPVYIEQFWPAMALVFNPHVHDKKVYPLADVDHMRHPQREYNHSRQGLREHRIQNRPFYVTAKGTMEDVDKASLSSPHSGLVIELAMLTPDGDINKLIQKLDTVKLDPALYDVRPIMEDIVRSSGSQDANFGVTNNGTATANSIAETSRQTTSSSGTDDIDEFLSSFARTVGQICLTEVSVEMVKKIVGPGAVWPEFNHQEIAEEVFLQIKAGSSGRPNQAADLAKMERAMPYITQLKGINPIPLGEKYAALLDIDPEELIMASMPSMTALNAMMAKAAVTPNPGTDPLAAPGQQGVEGSVNAGNPQETQPGPQPAYPTPTVPI